VVSGLIDGDIAMVVAGSSHIMGLSEPGLIT
jgi:hypothetical protein